MGHNFHMIRDVSCVFMELQGIAQAGPCMWTHLCPDSRALSAAPKSILMDLLH